MEHLIRRALLVLLLVLALVSVAAPAAADSSGIRWKHSHICVENWTTGARYDPVRAVVYHANRYTNLAIWHYGPRGCAANQPNMQKIIIGQEYQFSNNGAWTVSSQSPCTTAGGKAMLCFRSPVTIKLNTRYAVTTVAPADLAAHELGHALGLGHVSFTCDTAMRAYIDHCNPGQLTWWDRVGTTRHPGINRIYLW